MQIAWDQGDDAGWQALVPSAPLQQTHAYGQAMAALGATVRYGIIYDAGEPVAFVQALERRRLRIINRGPVWLRDLDRCAKVCALRSTARFAGGTICTADAPIAGWGLIPLITPRYHALWDITPNPGALRGALHGKWRNRLAASERAGVQIVQANPRGTVLAQLLTHEMAQRGQQGYRALPPAFVTHWPGQMRLFAWRHGGAAQAAMLFLRHGSVASYHIGWASPAARTAFAHGPMLWQAALALRAEGVCAIDLGDLNDDDAPGIAHFKRGTGAVMRARGATMLVLPG